MDEIYKNLLIHPDQRTANDIEILKENLITTAYLKKYQEDNGDFEYTKLIKKAYYDFVPKGELVFEFNAPSVEFFVLLSGKVSVHYKTLDEEANNVSQALKAKQEEEDRKKKMNRKSIFGSPVKNRKGPQRIKTRGKDIPKVRSLMYSEVRGLDVYYKHVKMRKIVEIEAGDSFGGMNISTDTIAGRMASILAVEDS
jgi:hypothetical protein